VCVNVEPQVLASLLEDPTWAESLEGGDPPDPEIGHRALLKWGETWNLSDAWCLDWACAELALRWAEKRGLWPPRDRAQALAASLALGDIKLVSGPPLIPEALRFEADGWEIEREDRRSFEARVTKQFRGALKAYGDENEQRAERAGLLRTPERRNKDHFFWLARHQVRGEKFADIARNTVDLTPKRVEVGVKRLASL